MHALHIDRLFLIKLTLYTIFWILHDEHGSFVRSRYVEVSDRKLQCVGS